MEITDNMIAYLVVAGLAGAFTIAWLFITKIPAVIVIFSAFLAGALYMLYARISDGHWDTFAPIAFVFVCIYASLISFALLGLGRLMGWPFFLRRPT